MIVKEVRKLKKNYQVTFTNGYKLIIDEDTLVQFRLRPGLEIESLEDIEKSIEKNKLFLKALKFASYGKSENQVIQYLNEDRKSTRLNSSHVRISYAVFCLKK